MRQRPKVKATVAEMLWCAEGTKQNKEQQIQKTPYIRVVFFV